MKGRIDANQLAYCTVKTDIQNFEYKGYQYQHILFDGEMRHEEINGKIIIDSGSMEKTEIPKELMHKLRSSVILAGAILGRFKKAVFSYPGGCDIGARPIDLHIKGFRMLGVDIMENENDVYCPTAKPILMIRYFIGFLIVSFSAGALMIL